MEKKLKNIQTFEQHTDKNLNISDVSVRYSDYLGEKYGQEYTISQFGDLDEYTDITSAFKAGMKKQAELIQQQIDGVQFKDL
jgi:hypothetical protein